MRRTTYPFTPIMRARFVSAAMAVSAAFFVTATPSAAQDARVRFAFQIPTYLVEKTDPERDAFTCDPAQPLCKLNLDLSPTFLGESASAWACDLDFGMGTPTGEETKCNPNVVTLTGGTLSVRLRAWRKAAPQETWSRELSVIVGAAPSVAETPCVNSGATAGSGSVENGASSSILDPALSASGSSQTGAVSDGSPAAGSGADVGSSPDDLAVDTGATSGSGTSGEFASGGVDLGPSMSGSEIPSDSAIGTASSGSSASTTGAALSPAILVQSGLDGQGRCLKPDCAVNFASSLSGSSYACAWDLDGGTFSSASSSGSCNPSYAHFPTGSGYRVKLSVKAKSGASGSVIFDALNAFSSSVATNTVTTYVERVAESSPPPVPAVAFPPVARIALQGRLTARFWAEGKSAGCTVASASGCTFNFDGRSSSAAQGASYAWNWGFGSGASGANPGAVRFPVGTWTVRLAVSDAYGTSIDVWSVEVAREAAPRVVAPTDAPPPPATLAAGSGSGESAPVPDVRTTSSAPPRCGYLPDGVTWACAAPAPAKTAPAPDAQVFSVRIEGQGVTGAGRSFTGGTYVCTTKEPSCSVNLAASVAGGKASTWSWEFPDGFAYVGPNPPARVFTRGEARVAVTAASADGRAARAEVRVVVGPPAPKKTVKKAVPKKASGGVSKNRASSDTGMQGGASSWTFSAEPQGPLEANAPLGWAALAASGASGISWLLARRWRG